MLNTIEPSSHQIKMQLQVSSVDGDERQILISSTEFARFHVHSGIVFGPAGNDEQIEQKNFFFASSFG